MKYIALHHTSSRNTGSPQLYGVNRYHKNKWGMKSSLGWYVGYNYFCDVDGSVTQTRAHDEEQVAQIGHNCDVKKNCDTISFSMAGDFRYQKPTEKQTNAFRDFVDNLKQEYPGIKVVGHRDLQKNRTCPALPQSYIKQFNASLDKEDREKNQNIRSTKIDLIRSLIRKLKKLISFYA